MIRICPASALGALLALACSAAQAQTANRAWVSGHGTDSAGCGAPTAPCRSLQYAHDHIVAAGGEIDVLDPAGYGAVSITKSISIINDGVGTAGVQATSGSAITINAADVTLRGLDIEGVGAANGVNFVTGGSLKVLDSTIKGFSTVGIQYAPTTIGYLYVSDTRILDSTTGLNAVPQISGAGVVEITLTRVELVNDLQCVFVAGYSSGPNVAVDAGVVDSVATHCGTSGITADSIPGNAATFIMLRNSLVSYSPLAVTASGPSVVYVGRSTLIGNEQVFTPGGGGGVIGSFGDNYLGANIAIGTTPSAVAYN